MGRLLIVLAYMGLAATLDAQSLVRDPATGHYTLSYTDLDGVARSLIVEAPDQVDPTLDVTIGRDGSRLIYRYSLGSRASRPGLLPIDFVDFSCPAADATLATVGLPTWWAEVQRKPDGVFCTFGFRSEPLAVGAEVSGLEINSTFLPGVIPVRVFGGARRVEFPTADATPDTVYTLVDRAQGFDFASGGGHAGYAVGPARSPASVGDPTSLFQALGEDLAKACGPLGWITNAGVCNSLRVKLTHAAQAAAGGDVAGARSRLNDFVNELEAQHGTQPGKHVTDNAYFLLKTNVGFLLTQLGQPQ